MVEETDNFLTNILHLLSPLHSLTADCTLREEDGIIETSMGFFRLGEWVKNPRSANPQPYLVLFYARHPDDFAGIPCDEGGQRLLHKDRVFVVSTSKIRTPKDRKWRPGDPRAHIDASWVRYKIAEMNARLTRVCLREATLHNVRSECYGSAFVGYRFYSGRLTNNGYSAVAIVPKLDRNFAMVAMPRLDFSSPLHVSRPDGQYHFPPTQILSVIQEDFIQRLKNIWKGNPAVRLREAPRLLLLTYARKAFSEKKRIVEEMRDSGWEVFTREATKLLIHMTLEAAPDLIKFLLASCGEVLSDFRSKEKFANIAAGSEDLVAKYASRRKAIASELHKLLLQPDRDQLENCRWHMPENYVHSFAVHSATEKEISSRTFQRWLTARFHIPYGGIFKYCGKNDTYVTVEDFENGRYTEKLRVIHGMLPNGLQLYYRPYEGILYAYHHAPDFIDPSRKFPANAGQFFERNSVIRLDLRPQSSSMEKIRYSDFRDELAEHMGWSNFDPISSDNPSASVCYVPNPLPTPPKQFVAVAQDNRGAVP